MTKDKSLKHLVKLMEKLISQKDQYVSLKRTDDGFSVETISGKKYQVTSTGVANG